jgi:hypothetical protein
MRPDPFIQSSEALEAARLELAQMQPYDDPLFAPWVEAQLGRPVLVRTVSGEKSYWLVPAIILDRAVGFVRVLGDGRAVAVGAFYQDPSRLDTCPYVVTGITAQEALSMAKSHVSHARGESASVPVFVHDGPQGREAWLVEVKIAERPARWIFVTPGGIYTRPAGEVHNDTLE